VIGVFIRDKIAGRPLTIHGDGTQTRDFTHVRDTVRANIAAMDAAVADGRALNVGNGESLSVNQIADIVGGPVVHVARRPGDARDTLADLTATRDLLGWAPKVATPDGIRELMRLADCP
jgi:UDP-glucose 4-epimerase